MNLSGSCLCGAIQYEIQGPIGTIVNCHCSMCRKWHGSAFRTRVTVHRDKFHLRDERAALVRFKSSEHLTKSFCKICGSSLFTFYDKMPEIVGVALGTLNADPGKGPECHVFVGSKAPWYEILDELPQFESFPENPKDVYRTE